MKNLQIRLVVLQCSDSSNSMSVLLGSLYSSTYMVLTSLTGKKKYLSHSLCDDTLNQCGLAVRAIASDMPVYSMNCTQAALLKMKGL